MYLSSDITKNDAYPDWIKNHPIFKDITSYIKIFPKFGLKTGTAPLTKLLAEKFVDDFLQDLIDANIPYYMEKKAGFTKLLQTNETAEGIYKFFSNLQNKEYIEIISGNKISLHLSENIIADSGKIIFKKGMSLFSVIEKAIDLELTDDLFSFSSFKDFSRLNIPLSSAEICFSTDPWDIATMSMRGIQTCQSWGGEYRQCVIGAMLDPFVGIIYLQSKGKATDYGSKMLYRATVRFAIETARNGKKKTPVLIIDHLYPEPFQNVLTLFEEYLTEKSGLKVLYAPNIESDITDGVYVLPKHKIKDTFKFYSEEAKCERPQSSEESIEPYQNITIKYSPNNTSLEACKKQKEIIKSNFTKCLIRNTSTTGIELSKFSSEKIHTLLALKNKSLVFRDQVKISTYTFNNALMQDLNLDDELDERSYKIKLYLNYFNKKKYLLESISNQVLQWNGSFGLRKGSALSKKDYVLIMQQAMQKADQVLKVELKAILISRPVDN